MRVLQIGTYFRDPRGGDWADQLDQRYYAVGTGRFGTPDPIGVLSAQMGSSQTWNQYAYVHGDPINYGDPTGTNLAMLDGSGYGPSGPCGSNWMTDASLAGPCPGTLYGGDYGGGSGGTGGSGGSYCGALAMMGFVPVPNPACYVPLPPPPEPPKLECRFSGLDTPEPGWGTVSGGRSSRRGYYVPVYLNYSAIGGDGGYIWKDSQTVSHSGSLTYSSGITIDWSQLPQTTEYPTNTRTGSRASFFDSPGVPECGAGALGCIVSGTVTWIFNVQVSVSSGSQSVQCPPVSWSVTETWTTRDGQRYVTGRAVLR